MATSDLRTNPIGASVREQILDFWFGDLDESGSSDAFHQSRWWRKDPALDDEIRKSFAATFVALLSSPSAAARPSWAEGPRGLLAAIIVLDQFSRNMFRDTPAMYSGDEIARQLTYEVLALGYDKELPRSLRTFAYMPLMHSERLVDQERCIAAFQELAEELGDGAGEAVLGNIDFAIRHRDIIAEFGRFPHRNATLGRPSTAQELEFLKKPGSSF
jgi:uncharacterized protein (DUF924 family)